MFVPDQVDDGIVLAEDFKGLSPSPFGEGVSSNRLECKAAVEGAVFPGPLPGVADGVAGIERPGSVSDFAFSDWNQRRVPDEVRHAAAEIVGHCLNIDRRFGGTHFVGFPDVLEINRSAAHGNDLAKCVGISALERA